MPDYYDLETVYDEQVSPLMTQIIAICEEHGIPMMASFVYKREPDDSYYCTSTVDSRNRATGDFRMAIGFLVPRHMVD